MKREKTFGSKISVSEYFHRTGRGSRVRAVSCLLPLIESHEEGRQESLYF